MIRLSVTHLDMYRYWRDTEDVTLSTLIERLTGKEPPSQGMLAGKAFHSLLENAREGEIRSAEMDGFQFEFDVESAIALPEVRELKAECDFSTPYGLVTLVGKVDAINGQSVHDYKLTERFEAERYTDSFQWRAYLTMFNARTFVYDVFQARYDLPQIIVYDYHRMEFHAYPGMREDVQREVTGLAEIVATHIPSMIREAA